MNLLPPLRLLQEWRESGLSPQEIYARCVEVNKNRKKALIEQAPQKIRATARQEAARVEKAEQRQRDALQVRSLREQNKTWEEISQAIGRSTWYISRLVEEAGIPNYRLKARGGSRPRKLPGDEELARLFQVKSVREICDFYSVTPMAVYERLDRAGIPRRKYKARDKGPGELS